MKEWFKANLDAIKGCSSCLVTLVIVIGFVVGCDYCIDKYNFYRKQRQLKDNIELLKLKAAEDSLSSSNTNNKIAPLYNSEEESNDDEEYYYICTGPYAKCYHYYDDCQGLNNCSGDIIAIPASKAEEEYEPCDYCSQR